MLKTVCYFLYSECRSPTVIYLAQLFKLFTQPNTFEKLYFRTVSLKRLKNVIIGSNNSYRNSRDERRIPIQNSTVGGALVSLFKN